MKWPIRSVSSVCCEGCLKRSSTRCHTCSPCPTITRRSYLDGMGATRKSDSCEDLWHQSSLSQERSQLHYFHYLLLLKATYYRLPKFVTWEQLYCVELTVQNRLLCWNTLLSIGNEKWYSSLSWQPLPCSLLLHFAPSQQPSKMNLRREYSSIRADGHNDSNIRIHGIPKKSPTLSQHQGLGAREAVGGHPRAYSEANWGSKWSLRVFETHNIRCSHPNIPVYCSYIYIYI